MYIYETHLHTSTSSKCGKATPEEQVLLYKKKGYDAICVTDHFAVGRAYQNWEDKINEATKGYEIAKEAGDKAGLKVFYGFEYTHCGFAGLDILVYGLDKNWLLANPEINKMGVNEFSDFARSQGGILIHAHPFREAGYIPMIRLLPRKVDAVEISNANRTPFENKMAKEYADNYNLPFCAGSDNHTAVQDKYCGIRSKKSFENAKQMARAIVDRKIILFEMR